MAINENDVTEGRDTGESKASRLARQRAVGESPLSASELAEAIAKAQERVLAEKSAPRPLGEVVRASVRVGLNRDGTPRSYTFKASDTADGKEWTRKSGQPIHLKREAYLRLAADSVVTIAE